MAGDVIIYRLYLALFHDGIVCTVEWGELGHWCELGKKFSELSPLRLLVEGHWGELGQKCIASPSLRLLVDAYSVPSHTIISAILKKHHLEEK